MINHVKLEQIEEDKLAHKLFINGKDISSIISEVNINVVASSVPECKVTLNALGTEYNGQADVKYDFTPKSVQQAIVVLRNELLKHREFYAGFRASVMSPIDECRAEVVTHDEMVDAIMKRLIGEE